MTQLLCQFLLKNFLALLRFFPKVENGNGSFTNIMLKVIVLAFPQVFISTMVLCCHVLVVVKIDQNGNLYGYKFPEGLLFCTDTKLFCLK